MRLLRILPILMPVLAGAATATMAGEPAPLFLRLWEVEGTRTNAYFGQGAAPAGDVNRDGYGDVIISAPGDSVTLAAQGRVFLYLGSPAGLSNVAAWTYVGDQAGAKAGGSVAPAGDVNGDGYGDVIVGLPDYRQAGVQEAGRALVFHGGPQGLSLVPNRTLLPVVAQIEQRFGSAVATAGDIDADGYDDIIVGAPGFSDPGASYRGAVYVYRGGPGGIPAAPSNTLLGRPQAAAFGLAVSGAGDMDADGYADILVGAPNETAGFANSGTFSLYRGSPGGLIVIPDTTIAGGSALAELGRSLAYLGDTTGDGFAEILVGEPGAPYDLLPQAGRVHRYYGGPGGISGHDAIHRNNQVANEHFGTDVASMGDLNGDGYADMAASGWDEPAGAARVTVSLSDGAEGRPYGSRMATEPTAPIFGGFGSTIAPSGDVDGDGRSEILVGDYSGTNGALTYAGRVELFTLPRMLPRAALAWPRTGPEPGTRYGQALAIVHGFPYRHTPALLIGDPGYQGTGQVNAHLPNPGGGLGINAPFTITGNGNFLSLGSRIVDAGDMNRDGYVDVAISLPTADQVLPAPQPIEGPNGAGIGYQVGQVDLYLGSDGAPVLIPAILTSGRDFDRVGSALAGRGDVNGDGYHDLLIGSEDWDSAVLEDCGKAWIKFGGPSGVTGTTWSVEGEAYGRGLGASVALGDLDADGYTDAMIGVVVAEGLPGNGRVQVHYGGPSGPSTTPGLVLIGNPSSPSFGRTVVALGDVTGDGICDLGVGAPEESDFGRVYVFAGTRGRSQRSAAIWTKEGTQLNAHFGEGLAGGGDLDGDGIAELVIGAPRWDAAQVDEGRVEVYFGASPVPALDPEFVLGAGINGARMGETLAPLTDLNEDGFADLAIGAPGAAGRAYVFFGAGGGGFSARMHVYDLINGDSQIRRPGPNLLTLTNEVWPFTKLSTAGGRGKIQVEYEIVVHNEPFTGLPTFRDPTVYDSGLLSGIGASEYGVPLPYAGRGYHLRSRIVRKSPYFPRSRWITPDAQVTGSLDFRTSGAVVDAGPGDVTFTDALRIARVAPNPIGSGAASHIDFVLPVGGAVTLDVFDVRGARVRRLVDGAAAAGPGSTTWDGRDDAGRPVGAGLYFLELRAGGRSDRAKVVRLSH